MFWILSSNQFSLTQEIINLSLRDNIYFEAHILASGSDVDFLSGHVSSEILALLKGDARQFRKW